MAWKSVTATAISNRFKKAQRNPDTDLRSGKCLDFEKISKRYSPEKDYRLLLK